MLEETHEHVDADAERLCEFLEATSDDVEWKQYIVGIYQRFCLKLK